MDAIDAADGAVEIAALDDADDPARAAGKAGEPRHGFCSVVVPVRDADGAAAGLKVTFDGDDESLQTFDGRVADRFAGGMPAPQGQSHLTGYGEVAGVAGDHEERHRHRAIGCLTCPPHAGLRFLMPLQATVIEKVAPASAGFCDLDGPA